MPSRVLITGARGFLGRPTAATLARRGFEVHAVTSGQPEPSAPVQWHRTDLLSPADVDALVADVEPTHLLHLAWHMAHGGVYGAVENVHWAEASLGLLRAFHRHGGRRAVLVGSCAEYDWTHDGPLDERAGPIRPASIYGQAKDGLRRLAMAHASACDLSLAWARIFFVFGPGEPPGRLVASVVRSLLAGAEAPCSHGRQVRDYLYVDDVAEALAALIATEVEGVVNVASGEGLPLRALVDEVARQLDGRDRVRYGAIAVSPDEAPRVVAAAKRLREEVGYVPTVDLASGVARTIDWWRAQRDGDA